MRKRSCLSSLPDPVAREIITHHPAVAREWAKWRAMGGPRGEILLINRATVELGLTLLAKQYR